MAVHLSIPERSMCPRIASRNTSSSTIGPTTAMATMPHQLCAISINCSAIISGKRKSSLNRSTATIQEKAATTDAFHPMRLGCWSICRLNCTMPIFHSTSTVNRPDNITAIDSVVVLTPAHLSRTPLAACIPAKTKSGTRVFIYTFFIRRTIMPRR